VRDEQELTPWFPPTMKPVRSGYYDTRICSMFGIPTHPELRLYWNNERKLFVASPHSRSFYGGGCFDQWRVWRGLAKEQANA
jgi:hypothetical protein